MTQPLNRVIEAINQTTVPRHEYQLTQGECHKRRCKCHATGNGRPNDALQLIIDCVKDSVRTLYTTGNTRSEIEMENLQQELKERWGTK